MDENKILLNRVQTKFDNEPSKLKIVIMNQNSKCLIFLAAFGFVVRIAYLPIN